jgi:hypothetical protein
MTRKGNIVERLRVAEKDHRDLPIGYVCQDAANEIERLQTALDQAAFASLRIGEGEMSEPICLRARQRAILTRRPVIAFCRHERGDL